jgi:hypothetical protein
MSHHPCQVASAFNKNVVELKTYVFVHCFDVKPKTG